MQDTAAQMNTTLSVLLDQLKTPTTTPFISTTTPPLDKCPDGPDKDKVTTDIKVYTVTNVSNVQCSHVFNADDGFNVVFHANVTIAGTGAALNIINAQTGNILKSITATSSEKVDTMVSNAQMVFSANWLSWIELHITYYSIDKSNPCEENPLICNNGTCTINPNTGGVLCICPACDSGDHCETEQNPCDAATARRKCRVNQSEAPGTCFVDDSITEYCAFKCNCTYPPGVGNQCGTGEFHA
ncbi:unnamed protein product [Haemonchus placei]|uniref:EGF-like domain-containing protein n=1 Tax=Haemonchus placei TaxID=6290 RepID=A0A0N4W2T2_HAEPC|nr:unnamed protein product [Haemonchus placei]